MDRSPVRFDKLAAAPGAPQAGQVYPSVSLVMPTAARGLVHDGDRRDAAVQYSRGGEGRGATVLQIDMDLDAMLSGEGARTTRDATVLKAAREATGATVDVTAQGYARRTA